MRNAIELWLVSFVSCAIGGVLPAWPAAAAEMVIVQDSQARATIVVAKDAPDPVRQKTRTAAEELQGYVQKISGAKLPIADDSQSTAGAIILVGRSRLSDAMGVAEAFEGCFATLG